MNHCFLQALNGCNEEGPPVWLMRQAGRHLETYRDLRKRYSFLQMCHEPDLIAKVTLLPIEAYQVDAAILFSDILVIAEAMGVGLRFEDKIGPIIERPIVRATDIHSLPLPDITRLQYVGEGIRLARSRLEVPLIGFCGGPFTVASYVIEGKSSRDLKKTKRLLFEEPQSFHALLEIISDWTIAYLRMQIESGVHAIQIFDTWANTLAYHQFREFSLSYLHRIMQALEDTKIPIILFCRGSSVFAEELAELNPAGIGLDWNCQMAKIRTRIPTIALQGNIDPDVLYAPLPHIEMEVERILEEMAGDSAFIMNLGHGLSPDVSEEAVRTFVNSVKRNRKKCLNALPL